MHGGRRRSSSRHGLYLNDVEYFPDLHGGTLRWHAGSTQNAPSETAQRYLAEEQASGLTGPDYYEASPSASPAIKQRPAGAARRPAGSKARPIAAYGAAAKGATLVNYVGIGTDLVDFVVDRNVHKQGRFMPGTHLPIARPGGAHRAASRTTCSCWPGTSRTRSPSSRRSTGRAAASSSCPSLTQGVLSERQHLVPVDSAPQCCPPAIRRSGPSTSRTTSRSTAACSLDDRQQAVDLPARRSAARLLHGRAASSSTRASTPAKSDVLRPDYEETQGFSPRFREFATRAGAAMDRPPRHPRQGQVLEIGCGKGEFLASCASSGGNRGVGIDPALRRTGSTDERWRAAAVHPDFYGEEYADLPADVVICRHTLEHIAPSRRVHATGAAVDRRAGTDTVVLFELPDVLRVLNEVAFWDIYYEHCSYFSPGSLARLFRRTGFDVVDLALDYDDQYLLIEARRREIRRAAGPRAGGETWLPLPRAVSTSRPRSTAMIQQWRDDLGRGADSGESSCGARLQGSRVPHDSRRRDEMEYAVDINPYKQGKFLAGTGQQVVAPEFLKDYRPGVVIAMNPVYTQEIGSNESMGVEPKLVAV